MPRLLVSRASGLVATYRHRLTSARAFVQRQTQAAASLVVALCVLAILAISPNLDSRKSPSESLFGAVFQGVDSSTVAHLPELDALANEPALLRPALPGLGREARLSPLEVASVYGDRQGLMEVMLDAGASPRASHVCLARQFGHGGLAESLQAALPASDGWPPLCGLDDEAADTLALARYGLVRVVPSGGAQARDAVREMPGTPVTHLAAGNRRLVERQLEAGWRPETPVRFVAPDGSFDRSVPPILVPVLLDDVSIVQSLVAAGAGPDDPGGRLAWCVARALGRDNAATVLAHAAAEGADPTCPEPIPAWVERLEEALRQVRSHYF